MQRYPDWLRPMALPGLGSAVQHALLTSTLLRFNFCVSAFCVCRTEVSYFISGQPVCFSIAIFCFERLWQMGRYECNLVDGLGRSSGPSRTHRVGGPCHVFFNENVSILHVHEDESPAAILSMPHVDFCVWPLKPWTLGHRSRHLTSSQFRSASTLAAQDLYSFDLCLDQHFQQMAFQLQHSLARVRAPHAVSCHCVEFPQLVDTHAFATTSSLVSAPLSFAALLSSQQVSAIPDDLPILSHANGCF